MKRVLILRRLLLCTCFFFSITTAIAITPQRLPVGHSHHSLQWHWTPTYQKAYGTNNKVIALEKYLIADKDVRALVDGTIERQEHRIEWQGQHRITTNWSIAYSIPFIKRSHRSSVDVRNPALLGLLASGDDNDGVLANQVLETIKNLGDEQQSGLGDTAVYMLHEAIQTDFTLLQWGPGVRIPTGSAGTPYGVDPVAIGDRQTDVMMMLHASFFPTTSGIRQGLQLEAGSQLHGKRHTLAGESGVYAGGNYLNAQYFWQYEAQNWLVGTAFLASLKQKSTLTDGSQNDARALYTVRPRIGYGNLSDLEQQPVSFPYQVALSVESPIHVALGSDFELISRGVPKRSQWSLELNLFF